MWRCPELGFYSVAGMDHPELFCSAQLWNWPFLLPTGSSLSPFPRYISILTKALLLPALPSILPTPFSHYRQNKALPLPGPWRPPGSDPASHLWPLPSSLFHFLWSGSFHHWSSAYLNHRLLCSLSISTSLPNPLWLPFYHIVSFLVFPEKEHFTGRNHVLDWCVYLSILFSDSLLPSKHNHY